MIEIIVVSVIALFAGAGVMKLLLKNKGIEQRIDRSDKKKYEAMNDPDLLLKRLKENGIMVDDGDEISFAIEVRDGKRQLVQDIKKNTVVSGSPTIKKKTTKKSVKKKGKKGGKGKKQQAK